VTLNSSHTIAHSPVLHTRADGSASRDNFNKKSSGPLSGSRSDVPYRSIHTLFQISVYLIGREFACHYLHKCRQGLHRNFCSIWAHLFYIYTN